MPIKSDKAAKPGPAENSQKSQGKNNEFRQQEKAGQYGQSRREFEGDRREEGDRRDDRKQGKHHRGDKKHKGRM